MNIGQYSLFMLINLVFILLVLRMVYFIMIAKSDPVKAIIPRFKKQVQKEDSFYTTTLS